MTLKEIVADSHSKRARQEVPFTEIEEALERAALKAGTETAAALTMGYSGNVFYEWRRKGVAPLTAIYILRGYLAETLHPFDTLELAYLIVAVNSCKTLPDNIQRDLASRLSKEIADVA